MLLPLLRLRRMGVSYQTVVVLLAATTACASDPPGGGTETSPTTSPTTGVTTIPTTTTPTTGYVPDPVSCNNPKPCDMGSDCCEGPVYDEGPCPGDFPNNWTCVNSQCVHEGCAQDSDCEHQLAPDLKCRTVGTVKYCVLPCGNDDVCERNMPGTTCIGVSATTDFCLENVTAP